MGKKNRNAQGDCRSDTTGPLGHVQKLAEPLSYAKTQSASEMSELP